MTGPEHTYMQVPWLTQWAMDLLSHTGAAVILRDQAKDPYCTGYDYISQHLLGVSALHYSTRSQDSEGVWTMASACVLCQPTIVCLSISIISIQEFGC